MATAAGLGFIVHNIETAEAESRASGGGTVVEGRLRDLFTELVTLMRRMHRMITAHTLTHEELAVLGLRAAAPNTSANSPTSKPSAPAPSPSPSTNSSAASASFTPPAGSTRAAKAARGAILRAR